MPGIERRYYQALQIWAVLALAAADGHKLAYKDVGEQVGIYHRQLNRYLLIIKVYCRYHGLPHLNALCVNGASGLPSDPEYGPEAASILAEALAYDWSRQPVSASDLAVAHALAEAERKIQA